MTNPTMTVKALRDALAKLPRELDDTPAAVWLPGSRIDLAGVMGTKPVDGELLIEGNVRPGSALDT